MVQACFCDVISHDVAQMYFKNNISTTRETVVVSNGRSKAIPRLQVFLCAFILVIATVLLYSHCFLIISSRSVLERLYS